MRGAAFRVIVSRNAARAYALSSVGDLLVINLATRAAVLTVATGLSATNGLVESNDGATVYVSSTVGNIAAVDTHTGSVVKTYQVAGTLQDLALSPDGLELYAADEGGSVIAMTVAGGTPRRISAQGSFGLAVSLDGSQLWVTEPSFGKILVIDRAQFLPLRTITLAQGAVPRRIVFDVLDEAVVSDEGGFVHLFR